MLIIYCNLQKAHDFSQYVGKHQLHALRVEELSNELEGIILKETYKVSSIILEVVALYNQ